MALAEPLLGEADDGFKKTDQVFKEERECIDKLHGERVRDQEDGETSEPFSLAFSGGGIRAAAFQAGVLWRLAEMNKLKDVEYFAAVSGGGYITSAFASHCLAAKPPEAGEVKKWYLDQVAQTVTRMQNNAGDFVRDCIANPGMDDGAGGKSWIPRFLDLPILLVTLVCTLLVNPVAFFVVFVVPAVFGISSFYGAAMRAAFCVPADSSNTWHGIFIMFSPYQHLLRALMYSAGALAVVWLLKHTIPSWKAPPAVKDGEERPKVSNWYLFSHALYSSLKRLTVLIAVLAAFVLLVPGVQVLTYKPPVRTKLCLDFMDKQRGLPAGSLIDCANAINHASPLSLQRTVTGDTWYNDVIFANYTQVADKKELNVVQDANFVQTIFDFTSTNTLYIFAGLWLVFLMLAICLMPAFGSGLLSAHIIPITGPWFLLVVMLAFTQYCIFGPITQNKNGLVPYDPDLFESFVTRSLWIAFFLVPFYEELRASLHTYYKRCLQVNFFKDGEDVPLYKVAEHKYCPFIILTGTSSDFQPPGDTDVISELSFTGLHTGSEETDYVDTPDHRSLAKITAITGAGCLDAISLSMSDAISLRFWLEILNLSWGDYLLFTGKGGRWQQCIEQLTGGLPPEWKSPATRLLHRLPSGVIWMLAWIWLVIAWNNFRTTTSFDKCSNYLDLLTMAFRLVGLIIMLSFFSAFSGLGWLATSPLLRQLQQATKYFYVGARPPQMLYVTDGGVKDCTALVQLMRRKCKRILLVLAAADAHDDLGVLKTAMQVAKDMKIGYFYDPVDPRRDLEKTFKEYKKDRSISHLHIGITYEDAVTGQETHGHLYIVKNRLPPEHEKKPVRALLTPQEVMGEPGTGNPPEMFANMNTDDLGPFCCCDWCHTTCCNCGPKFPHGTFTGYMYLSPQWANSLSRLGHAVSEEAIKEVTRSQTLERQ